MTHLFKQLVTITLLLITGLVYAEEKIPSLTVVVDNQLEEDVTLSVKGGKYSNDGIALAKNHQPALTIPLKTHNNDGVIILTDKNNQPLHQINYSLESVYFNVDGAQAGPDWKWQPLKVTSQTDRKISAIVTKNVEGVCSDTNLMGCSKTVEIQIIPR